MAILKRFIHFKKFSDFNSKKLSANETNTQYTVGVSGEIQNGEPDVLYQSYCWIKDTQQQWTHGQLYNGSIADNVYITDFTIQDLKMLSMDEGSIQSNVGNLIDAVNAGKKIYIHAGVGEGYAPCVAYIVDMVYIDIFFSTREAISVEIPVSSGLNEIRSEYVTVVDLRTKSDWNETDIFSDAFINNKPTIPTKTSQLENDSNFVSSDGLKTINGESIVGSGNIEISGGSSNSAYSEVNHGTADTTFTLTPNTFHVWDEVASLTLDFGSDTSGVANEYLFQFTSGTTATSLTLPDDIKWANDSAPTIEANMIYQVSILKGLASVLEFSNTIVFPAIGSTNGLNNEEYAKVYEYFVNTYNLTSTSAKPANGVIITETLMCIDTSFGGPVLKVSLNGTMLLLWTQNAINNLSVPSINNLGKYLNYMWD